MNRNLATQSAESVIGAMLMRMVFPVGIVAVVAAVIVATATSGYCCGYLKAWGELQCFPPVVIIDDAILAEATDLCRELSTRFPDNADYQSRLDALVRLQTRHFSEAASETKP